MNYLSQQVSEDNSYNGKYFALGNDLTYDRSIENNFIPKGITGFVIDFGEDDEEATGIHNS